MSARNGEEDPQQCSQKVVYVRELDPSDSDSSGPPTSEEDGEAWLDAKKSESSTTDLWIIQKLIRYMKTGNQTATLVGLCCIQDFDLTLEGNQMAIRDNGGLEVLVNVLETKELKIKLCALDVLKTISENIEIRINIINLGITPILVALLDDPAKDLQMKAAQCLAMVCLRRKARKIVRKYHGIAKVIDLLDVSPEILATNIEELNDQALDSINLAMAGAEALCSLSASRNNCNVMASYGVIPLLARCIHSIHERVTTPALAVLANSASIPHYSLGIITEGMIPDIVKSLEGDEKLQTNGATTIFKCAVTDKARDLIRIAGGLDPLVKILSEESLFENKKLLAGTTGAVWMCAKYHKNIERFNQLQTVSALVRHLEDTNEEVLTNTTGALSELLKDSSNHAVMVTTGGIKLVVNLLNETYVPLLRNVPLVIMQCARDSKCMDKIEELDGVRLVWSLLKNSDPRVQENAAWALCPCIEHAKESGEMCRSFVGGLQLTVSLLSSEDTGVLAAVCAALSVIAKDLENLAVISDHGVVKKLCQLVDTKDKNLRQQLGAVIANSCSWGGNCKEYGRRGAIPSLVSYMIDDVPSIHRTTAQALFSLSKNAFNCITMHESGVVPYLLKAVSAKDEVLQEAAAGCLKNIRKLALEAETFHLYDDKDEMLSEDDEDAIIMAKIAEEHEKKK
ncbi:armadillo repeat-containing protein gudu [Chrysoperla carnea]|uniref:armadillo repeat-containing protein gudu n=1 Tax=Chrysoperla carnea TaxID=189513 RepID=UPI001D066ED3|nr:armadillo repeat-containing protein gudu [Chrysoperla carnea]